jgi:hypothetical protein
VKEIPVKIYNFFGRPPYKNMPINAVIAYGIIILSIFSLILKYPIALVCALFAVLLGVKLFTSESGHRGGKLIYGAIAIIVVQGSQMLADFTIQGLIQTNPGQLVNGQRFLTISFIIMCVVAIIYILMIIVLVGGSIGAAYKFSVEHYIKRFYALAHYFSITQFFSVIL